MSYPTNFDVDIHSLPIKGNCQCTIEIKPCGPQEDRRMDGTCNNYGVPAGGASGGPYKRMALPENKKADLPSARNARTTLLSIGRDDDQPGGFLTSASSAFINFITSDISAIDTSISVNKSDDRCCGIKDKQGPRCFPIFISKNGSTSEKECLEFYRAVTFKELGCSYDYQINFQTPAIDLSQIYGVDESSHKTVRKGENGLLSEFENNTNNTRNIGSNAKKFESKVCVPSGNTTTCYYIFGPPNAYNYDIRSTILSTWFIREHNRLATALHELNPCWKDDRLFKVARSINIATVANIFLYELLPLIMGYRNMVNSGLLSQQIEYVTLYEDAVPLVYTEYVSAMNYFLTLRNGRIKKFDDNNRYIGDLHLNETLFNQELIGSGKNYDEISRGMILQKAGKVDSELDPEIGEVIYNGNEKSPDLFTAGIQRSRDMGVASYNRYREMCGMTAAKKFHDFLDSMSLEKMEALKDLYNTVDDVELIPGLMSEIPVQNGLIGPTLYCIITKQLQLFRYSDRFWFERGDQFHSFLFPQLQEIRKSNMARVVCDNSQAIEFIQPHAFQATGPGNMPLPCSFIPGPDLTAWSDSSCGKGNTPNQFPSRIPIDGPYSYMEILTFFDDMLRNKTMSHV
ncbi:peroxidase-like [Amyelois transitella]|uniref:peroxidase-like n=1 Tax=Amyelois transitella TaxID=680683 RepID=UPI00298FE968|nr:peroxidase-like [Amyelois transitella]